MAWQLEYAEGFLSHFRRFEKGHSSECKAMLANLKTFFKALEEGIKPASFTPGFVHREGVGIKALDQKGADLKKPKQTRLYVYAEEERTILHVIIVGDKESQSKDVLFAKRYVDDLRKGQGI